MRASLLRGREKLFEVSLKQPAGSGGIAVYGTATCVDDRRVISGIVHVLKSGARWVDAPTVYGLIVAIWEVA
jgi:transposase